MKYLKVFTQHSDYEEFIDGGGVNFPNVSYCQKENEVHYNPLQTSIMEYISSDGKIVDFGTGNETNAYFYGTSGKKLHPISNTYENGKGILILDGILVQTNGYMLVYGPNNDGIISDEMNSNFNRLISITLPSSFSSFSRFDFTFNNLETITFTSTKVPSYDPNNEADSISGSTKCYVPKGTLNLYKPILSRVGANQELIYEVS